MLDCVIIRGMGGSGKTTLCKEIKKVHPDFVHLSLDDFKVQVFERHGYRCKKERDWLNEMAVNLYFTVVEAFLKQRIPLLLEHSFNDKHKKLVYLLSGYSTISIKLLGDSRELYDNMIKRDLSGNRPQCLVRENYYIKEDESCNLVDPSIALMSFEEYDKAAKDLKGFKLCNYEFEVDALKESKTLRDCLALIKFYS